MSSSTNWAVLVLDDGSKEKARKLFNTPLVFNIHGAKGLEFKNVILYKFMSHEAYNKVWNIVKKETGETEIEEIIEKVRNSYQAGNIKTSRTKDKEDKSLEKYKFYMNALYVGVSRAIDSVYIIDNERKHNLLKVIKPEKTISVDIKKEESSPEEWKNMALKLIEQGNLEQARGIAETRLLNKEEYVAEIMNELKAKGYCEEDRDLDKYKQELKTEPQKPSMSASKVPKNEKSQDKKYQNEKKKLTKEKLAKNTKKLFSALKNSNLQLAEKLIEQGVNVNARDKVGNIPLHLAALDGHENVVKLLLKHKEIDVNCRTAVGLTPLYVVLKQGDSEIVDLLLADSGINVGCIKIASIEKKDKEKFSQKFRQDYSLFQKVEKAANEKYRNKRDELFKEIKELMKQESEYGFKPSLNYSPNGKDENTTLKIAIKAGGEVLQLLYDYAEKEMGVDTKIFKQLKHTKKQQESSQPKSDISNISISSNLTQEFKLG